MKDNILCFALTGSRETGEQIAAHLNIPLALHEEREFEDGEHKIRPLTNVRGKDAFVVHSLHGDDGGSVNDKLCRLLFFIGALKENGATRVTAVIPYMCYSRKDRQTKPRDPVTTKYLACLLEAAGTDSVITMDIHNLQAFQNAHRCQTVHLEAARLFANHFQETASKEPTAVMSPDFGGAKRAEQFREMLEEQSGHTIPFLLMEKQRSSGEISGQTIVGNPEGMNIIIIDDLTSSGGTLVKAARAAKEKGAKSVTAAVTHGVFSEKANETLKDDALDQVVVTNTVPVSRLTPDIRKQKVRETDASGLFAGAIQSVAEGGNIEALLGYE